MFKPWKNLWASCRSLVWRKVLCGAHMLHFLVQWMKNLRYTNPLSVTLVPDNSHVHILLICHVSKIVAADPLFFDVGIHHMCHFDVEWHRLCFACLLLRWEQVLWSEIGSNEVLWSEIGSDRVSSFSHLELVVLIFIISYIIYLIDWVLTNSPSDEDRWCRLLFVGTSHGSFSCFVLWDEMMSCGVTGSAN